MNGPTHDLVAVSAAAAAGTALRLPLWATVVLEVVAWKSARLPDRLEFGRLPHRGPTHRVWLGLALAGAAWLAMLFASALFVGWMADSRGALLADHRDEMVAFGSTLAALVGGGVALGVLVGHLAADACTIKGIHVMGREVHLVPVGWRVNTHTGEREGRAAFLVVLALGLYLAAANGLVL